MSGLQKPSHHFSKVRRLMEIFPVLDLMNGQVVRGVAGRRESYRPVESVLTEGSEPLEVAGAFKKQLGLSRFYIADLDAIRFGQPQLSIIEELADHYPGLWLDSGLRTPGDVPRRLISLDVVFVAGLETIAGPRVLRELCRDPGPERIVFSLDLKNGEPMGNLENWPSPKAWDIAREAIDAGVRKLIILDLAQVGVGAGLSTLPLCQEIKRSVPEVKIITGGGIRDAGDLLALKNTGIDGALVASAFHNGNIRRCDLK